MSEVAKIRVIKKGQELGVPDPRSYRERSKKEGRRRIAATVLIWINDLKVRKSMETIRAFEQFQ